MSVIKCSDHNKYEHNNDPKTRVNELNTNATSAGTFRGLDLNYIEGNIF